MASPLRISTTTLEAFRLFMQPDQEWMAEADLLATIRGEFVSTRPIEIGLAFERVLQDPRRYQVVGGYRCDGFSFDEATMREPLALVDPRGVFQVKATKPYAGGEAVVVMKADQIIGAHVQEWKTTTEYFAIDKYLESYQWRVELDILEAPQATYHVFELYDHENSVIELQQIHSFNVFAYPALHADCERLVGEFVEYVTRAGLDGLLRARQRAAEAAA